ncbi:unnamed protein product [Brassica oleracea]
MVRSFESVSVDERELPRAPVGLCHVLGFTCFESQLFLQCDPIAQWISR